MTDKVTGNVGLHTFIVTDELARECPGWYQAALLELKDRGERSQDTLGNGKDHHALGKR